MREMPFRHCFSLRIFCFSFRSATSRASFRIWRSSFFLVQLLLQGVLLQFFLLLVEFVIASVTHKCVPAQFTGFGKPVEQSAVVTDNDQGGTAFLYPFVQSVASLVVKVIGRFVHQYGGRLLQFQASQEDPRLFSTAQCVHGFGKGSVSESPAVEGLRLFFDVPVVIEDVEMIDGGISVQNFIEVLCFRSIPRGLGNAHFIILPEVLRHIIGGRRAEHVPEDGCNFPAMICSNVDFATHCCRSGPIAGLCRR